MYFIADESCDFIVVRALRKAGHDVLAIAEVYKGAEDDVVAELAQQESRILITEDKDFGRMFYAETKKSGGVIFIRYPANVRCELGESVISIIQQFGSELRGKFFTLQPGRLRITDLQSDM
ncbi:MAG TPA: DUF5615 family PIN-like protein [Candidatus Hydrogenedentes bacterium]|nr:DUF5615 family PIN-like protein [Candidatus Hydrogenedentota bacterium]